MNSVLLTTPVLCSSPHKEDIFHPVVFMLCSLLGLLSALLFPVNAESSFPIQLRLLLLDLFLSSMTLLIHWITSPQIKILKRPRNVASQGLTQYWVWHKHLMDIKWMNKKQMNKYMAIFLYLLAFRGQGEAFQKGQKSENNPQNCA